MTKRKSKASNGNQSPKHSSSSDDGLSQDMLDGKVPSNVKAQPTRVYDQYRKSGYSIGQLAMLGVSITLVAAVFGPILFAVLKKNISQLPPSESNIAVEQPQIQEAISDNAVWFDSPNGVGRRIGSNYVCKHDYKIKIVRSDPLIMVIEDFLQPGEANHMMNISASSMTRSGLQFSDGVRFQDDVRTSTTSWITYDTDAVTHCIQERVQQFTSIPAEDIEALQVIRYQPGQQYKPHYDFMREDDMLMFDDWSRIKGQRWATMIVYLNAPQAGGATIFPRLNLAFPPVKNSAIFWLNLGRDGLEDWRTEHAGEPVQGGEKWAMNIWPHKMTRPVYERILRLTAEREAARQQQHQQQQVN
ncbi:hypothetical protein BDF19DRAFT_113729 [Syncephalis fuscata]|nr:hypothetical protein BDF19DRAFT_113729 [Syncephalis fuscata]